MSDFTSEFNPEFNTHGIDFYDVLKLITKNTFRPFDDIDWCGFAGCVSETPLISTRDFGDGKFHIYIIDGRRFDAFDENDENLTFEILEI
jgi:hypothetical protein